MKIGDTVYVETTKYSTLSGYVGTVKNITPTGMIDVERKNQDYTARFDNKGLKRVDAYASHRLVAKERYDIILAEMVARDTRNEINRVLERISGCSTATIIAKCEEAIALARTLPEK